MQRLRRAEHRAAKRMGDHDVIANFDGEHGCLSRIADELAEYAAPGLQDIGKTRGKFAETQPPARAARRGAGRAASFIAASSRWRWVNAARCDGATLPTWLEMIFRRRLWNAPPSGTATVPAPYQLSSMIGRLVAGDVRARWQVPRRVALA